ncbi:hypothetical protein EDB83DRAFT_2320825 [Lactarius deliciosus]|nr:hypothetical protein EDB83DRAFT_2320825 [Lactarius deliciosus]
MYADVFLALLPLVVTSLGVVVDPDMPIVDGALAEVYGHHGISNSLALSHTEVPTPSDCQFLRYSSAIATRGPARVLKVTSLCQIVRLQFAKGESHSITASTDQQISHTTHAKSAMQAGNRVTDREEDGVGNMSINIHFSLLGSFLTPTLTPATSTIVLIHGYPQPRTSKPHTPHVPSWQCRLVITQQTGRRDLDQDDGNGNDEGNKRGNGESESDDGDDGDRDNNNNSSCHYSAKCYVP